MGSRGSSFIQSHIKIAAWLVLQMGWFKQQWQILLATSNPANHDDLSIQALSAKPFLFSFCAVHG